jgi:hypothetical protein
MGVLAPNLNLTHNSSTGDNGSHLSSTFTPTPSQLTGTHTSTRVLSLATTPLPNRNPTPVVVSYCATPSFLRASSGDGMCDTSKWGSERRHAGAYCQGSTFLGVCAVPRRQVLVLLEPDGGAPFREEGSVVGLTNGCATRHTPTSLERWRSCQPALRPCRWAGVSGAQPPECKWCQQVARVRTILVCSWWGHQH